MSSAFPDLTLEGWRATCDTLHAYAQVLSAIRGALTPRQKHWWHTPLSVSAAGLTTTPVPAGERVFELILNPTDHCVYVVTNRGERKGILLQRQSAAEFGDVVLATLSRFGINFPIDRKQFADARPRDYDKAAAERFWQVLPLIDAALKELKGEHRGESGPVVLWPHGFDLALLLFSGCKIPGKDSADEESADEQMNFGFSTGDAGIPEPYFYATAYPTPAGFVGTPLPDGASWHTSGWTGAVLRYGFLRTMADPTAHLLEFLRAARDAGFARMK